MSGINDKQATHTKPLTANILVTSIGTANPRICATIAQDLDLPSELFVRAVFQAPTILFKDISRETAEKLSRTLQRTGLQTKVCQTEPPATERLYDVALHLNSMAESDDIFSEIANFIGSSVSEAVRLVSDAPGVILGDVSKATVYALAERMSGFDVQVLSACKTDSLYDLFLTKCDVFTQRYLTESLGDKMEFLTNGGVMCRSLNHAQMEKIWMRMRTIKGLKIINQAFECWDIYLDGGQNSAASVKVLSETCNIPLEVCEQLFEHCPIIISENVLNADLKGILKKLTDSHLTVRAELTTFQHASITIKTAPKPKSCLTLLKSLGLAKPEQAKLKTPLTVPRALPSFDARMLCNKLNNLGCTYEMEVLA